MIRSRIGFATLFALPLMTAGCLAGTKIAVGPFTSLQLRGGGHVVLQQGASQSVQLIKGSTKFTSFKLEGSQLVIEGCNWQCPHQYELEIAIVSPHVEGLAVRGGGQIDAKGEFPRQAQLSVAVVGGGEVDARAVGADQVNAAVTGGGRIHVKPLHDLHAAVTGGGEINYSGNPGVTQAVVGGGSISRE